MNNRFNYLLDPNTTIVFDIDGVLAAYEFGQLKHDICLDDDWELYVKEHKPYDQAKPIPQIQKFVKDKGVEDVYVCSVAAPLEEENKRNFVMREYGIPASHIFFVREAKDKVAFLKTFMPHLAKGNKEETIAIVEDTTSTLNQVSLESDCVTIHVSSFFFY